MELVFQQCMSLYSTIQCLQPVHGQQDTFAEQKMHPSTQQNSGLKLSMNILRTLTSNTGFHTTRRSLRPLVGRPYSFREQYREKSIVFTPPLSRHRGFRFPAVQHTPCLFRLQSNASNLSMDLLRHFKTQWILYETRKLPRTLIRKSPYTKAGPLLRITVPRFDIRGQPFRSHPCHGPIHYSTRLCF
ncbi:hypothetical protein TNCT_673401 [Trichonephila clavata]|uniref:Uncharacterized protein n=1 Tax=Trichonephila clavata TaxID=2740835 RepID=A0A8X6FUG9_TRICU|nr:hypothetical protein TNCT_673401 [Trichonephila clavata]